MDSVPIFFKMTMLTVKSVQISSGISTHRCSSKLFADIQVLSKRLSLGNQRQVFVKAQENAETSHASKTADEEVREEVRLEAIEASLRSRKGARQASLSKSPNSSINSGSPYAEWKEGQLFPEGWEEMDPLQKMTELYMGQRGFLFWSTKLATGGVLVLAVSWVIFRFVLPSLGLYQLTNDINTPSF